MPTLTNSFFSEFSESCGCRRSHSGGSASAFGGAGATPHYPPSLELEPVHLEIDLSLDLETQTATLAVKTTVVCNHAGARSLKLDGVAFLDLSVRDTTKLPMTFAYDGKAIEVSWEKAFALGEKRTVETRYRVERPASGLFFMKPTPEYPRKPLYAATDHETELARYWLSCVDLPNVRTTLEFKITAKSNLTILANGALLGEMTNADGTKTARWRLDQRCPSYLVCVAVGDFVRFDDGVFDGMPLAYFACRDFTPKDLERSFGRTRAILQWMTGKLGVKFPFPKYYQFALPAFGGAMENISLVSWSDRFVCDERHGPEGVWLVDQVNVHEMAHSYFGDLVVCRDFAHAWLKESWATYMETCWLEDSKGADEQLYDLYCNALSYLEEADSHYARPLVTRKFTSSWQMYDRHLYPGGACRLHTFRKEIGDEVFWRAVGDYVRTYREQVVETDDFRRMLEKHSGRSLQKLFDQWVHSSAYPHLKVTFAYDAEKRRGTFEVEQKQVSAKKDVLPFELSTELGWTIDGQDHVLPIRLTDAKHSFQVPMAKDPEQVRFDPAWKILHKLDFDPGETRLKRQLAGAKDVVGRIHAAVKLCASGKRAALAAVVAAYAKEPFWGVRREMAKAIAAANTEEAVDGIAHLIGLEQDPMVLDRLFAAAGDLRDARIGVAIERRLDAGGLPPGATAAAYAALGSQRETAPIERLKSAAAKDEPRYGVEQAAALHALGKSRREELVPFLLDAARFGRTPYRARAGAVNGLAALAPVVAKGHRVAIEERLSDLLRDPEAPLRMAAARALREARGTGAASALEAYRARLPLQEQVKIDEVLAALRRDDDARLRGLEKTIDELTAKLRQVANHVQELEDRSQRTS
jgi:aminopeptidase N